METWYNTIIEGYQVSNIGNIKSLERIKEYSDGRKGKTKERILKLGTHTDGYPQCMFTYKGKNITRKVHRLVAIAFIPNPDNKPCVNHKNGIKTDNRVENLEWCTKKENSEHAYATGLNRGRQRGEHNQARLVLNTENGIFYDCAVDAGIAHNIEYKKLQGYLSGAVKNKTNLIYA